MLVFCFWKKKDYNVCIFMTWLHYALLAPFFWTLTNFIDKYSLHKFIRSSVDYLFFATITSWIFLFGIVIFFGLPTWSIWSLLGIGTGILLNYSYYFYINALKYTDTSQLIIFFQGIPVVTVLLEFIFFRTQFGLVGLAALLLVVVGGLVMSLENIDVKSNGLFKLNKSTGWIAVSVLMWSLVFLFAGKIMNYLDFWSYFFYENLGFAISGIILLLFKNSRNEIVSSLKEAKMEKYAWFAVNNFLDFLGQMSIKFALALSATVGAVTIAIQIQSVYGILIGLFFTLFFPLVLKEDLSRLSLLQKCFGAVFIFAGVYLLTM